MTESHIKQEDKRSKVALVTGARRGIGRAIAEALLEAGWEVLLSARSPENPEGELMQTMGQLGKASYITCDISDPKAREALVERVAAEYGQLDLLVNNAGMAPRERLDLLDMTPQSFEELMAVNLEGPFFLTQAFAKQMLAARDKGLADYHPRIIFVTSVSAEIVSVNRGEYCMSKAALSMAVKLFAARLGEADLPVFELRPGIIQTDMTAGVHERYKSLIEQGLTPIPRFGQGRDVAEAVLAIAAGYLDFSTGQSLAVDGGLSIGRL